MACIINPGWDPRWESYKAGQIFVRPDDSSAVLLMLEPGAVNRGHNNQMSKMLSIGSRNEPDIAFFRIDDGVRTQLTFDSTLLEEYVSVAL